jgi:eukaryotic-like serine/threonine-protein kinase
VNGAIAVGERLKDRYRLERVLGRGGMAAVWLGHDEVLDRPVAIKVLSDSIAADPQFVARFRREAKVAAGLSHPHLVGVYDYGDEGERPYLVMQFVPGESLASLLERGAPLDADRLARELLDALAHIHDAGILHRDVKPQNILIDSEGAAKLIDFGIARPRDATSLTQTGLVLGTQRYAAPEVMAGQTATERSDLYSCGVVLRGCLPGASLALRALVARLTARDPRERPTSARAALAELERGDGRAGEATAAFAPSFEEPLPDAEEEPTAAVPVAAPGTPPRRHRLGAVAALLGVAAALIVAAVVVAGGGDGKGGEGLEHRQATAGNDAAGAAHAAGASRKDQASDEESTAGEVTSGTEEGGAEGAEPATVAAPEGADPAGGPALNEEGFAMLQAGEYEAAVPVLEEAVRAFPAGSEELDYAYALFNLGNALRLSGHPEEAIPVLERRLQIPNQTDVVERELAEAEAEAG